MTRWLLIKGTESTQHPYIEAVPRKNIAHGGESVHGQRYDFARMQERIDRDDNAELFNTVENLRLLECKTVIENIKEFEHFAKRNRCRGISIYYTGNGKNGTGDWCFRDGVITLDEVLRAVKCTFGRKRVSLYLDASYSGNWALDFRRYCNGVRSRWRKCAVYAACYPAKRAYDTECGGAVMRRLRRCIGVARPSSRTATLSAIMRAKRSYMYNDWSEENCSKTSLTSCFFYKLLSPCHRVWFEIITNCQQPTQQHQIATTPTLRTARPGEVRCNV